MSIITLTTDFGIKGPYTGVLKGKIYKEIPEATIVDISHEIQPFDISEGAFVVKNAYRDFPEGSIHIINVDGQINPNNEPIAAHIDGHYFLTVNNGILSLINSEIQCDEVVEITIGSKNSITASDDIFVSVAAHILRGGKLSVVGNKMDSFKELYSLRPIIKENRIIVGTIIYIDNYGNAITNISKRKFEKVGKKRAFRIWNRNHEFTEVYENYTDFIKDFEKENDYLGREMALFGMSGYLEIAIYKGNPQTYGGANTLLGLKKGNEVFVEFL